MANPLISPSDALAPATGSDGQTLREILLRRSAGALALRVTGMALTMGTSVFLARVLGAGGYGSYTYAKTWIGVLGVVVVLGLDVLALRNLASYRAQSEWSLMRGLLERANRVALLASGAFMIAGGVAALLLAKSLDADMLSTLLIALLMLPLVALMRVRAGALQGLHRVLAGLAPEMVIQPTALLVMIAAAYLLLGGKLSAPLTMGLNIAAAALALVVVARLLREALPQSVEEASPTYRTREWLRSALPLFFVSATMIVMSSTDLLMLGSMLGSEEVGTYAVAKRMAGLMMFIIAAINTALAPTIASLYASGNRAALQRVFTKSMRAGFFATLPIGIVFILAGGPILQIFGPEFASGERALWILTVGQLAGAAMGSVSLLLLMTGHERETLIGGALGTVINGALNFVLLPRYGIEGAAAATTISVLGLTAGLVVCARLRTGIRSTILGDPSGRSL